MKNYIIYLFLFTFLIIGASVAQADQVQIAVNNVSEQADLSDEALASYITGRLKLALKNEDTRVEQFCDASGCSVVVQ